MTAHTVSTSYGTLNVHLSGSTVGRVEGTNLVVNRVVVDVSAWVKPNTNPHSLAGLGTPKVDHLSIKKVDGTDWRWEASWAMREKIEAAVLSAFQTIAAVPALAHEADLAKAADTLARAQSKVEAADKALAEALSERNAAHAEWMRLASVESAVRV